MNNSLEFRYYVFRIACAMCLIGHGAFGIITKPVWCNYFGVFGIGTDTAYQLMPIVGTMDIALGLLLLFYPLRFAAAWLVLWGVFTALLRPLSGEPFAEFMERAGNFGAPFVLLLLSEKGGVFQKLQPAHLHIQQEQTILRCLQVFAFLLLAGHGWLNLLEKQGLIKQYEALGFDDPYAVARYVGITEVVAAVSFLIKPIRAIILALFVWKMASELFYPAHPFFEWVERGGSYAVLLGLGMVAGKRKERKVLLV